MQTPTTSKATDPSPPRWRKMTRRLLRWSERCFAILGLLAVLYVLMFDISTIISPSMSPTLRGTNIDNGDRVLTEKVSYRFRNPRRWEVITFLNNEGQRVMKRVIGLPGETVQV